MDPFLVLQIAPYVCLDLGSSFDVFGVVLLTQSFLSLIAQERATATSRGPSRAFFGSRGAGIFRQAFVTGPSSTPRREGSHNAAAAGTHGREVPSMPTGNIGPVAGGFCAARHPALSTRGRGMSMSR